MDDPFKKFEIAPEGEDPFAKYAVDDGVVEAANAAGDDADPFAKYAIEPENSVAVPEAWKKFRKQVVSRVPSPETKQDDVHVAIPNSRPIEHVANWIVSEADPEGMGRFIAPSSRELIEEQKKGSWNPIAEQVGRAAPEVFEFFGSNKGREIYESLTGRKFYTEEELNNVSDDRLRHQLARQQDTILWNAGADLYDIARGLVSAVPAAGVGIAKSLSDGYGPDGEGGVVGALTELADDATDVIAGIGVENLRSIEHTINNPMSRLQDEPLQALLDVAQVGGAVKAAKAAKGGKLARTAAVLKELSPVPIIGGRNAAVLDAVQDVRPTNLLKRGVDSLATRIDRVSDTRAGTAVSQWLLDARAGVPEEVLKAVDDYRAGKSSRINLALEEADSVLQRIPVEERAFARDLLAGEETRLVEANWPDRVPRLKASIQKAIRKGFLDDASAKELLQEDPAFLDKVINQLPGKQAEGMGDAEAISRALSHRAISVVDEASGQDIGSLPFMLFGGKVDPSKIRISVNATSPFAVRALELKNELESVRKLYIRLGNEAEKVNVGKVVGEGAGAHVVERSLLPLEVLNKHQGYYMPDVLRGNNAFATGTASIVGDLAETGASPFAASKWKNLKTFQERVKIGAEADLERAMKVSIQQSINEIEKYKLLDKLSKVENGSVLSPARMDELLQQKPELAKRYVKVPVVNRENLGLPQYGALSGMYIDRGAFRFLKSMEEMSVEANRFLGKLASFTRRFRSAWSTAKVVDNLPSWMNNLSGNVMHNLMDGGLLGSADYLRTISRQIGDALPDSGGKLKSDPFYRAALEGGIIDTQRVDALGEVGGLRHALKSHGSPLQAIQEWAKDLPRRAREAWKTQGVEAALIPYETVVRDNFIVDKLGKAFGAVDTGSRLTLFKRFIEREAKRTGRSVGDLLQDTDVINDARQYIGQYHYDYSNVPLAVQWADKHFVFPFSQFAWKSFGSLADTIVTAPQIQKTGYLGDRMAYENASEDERFRRDNQATRSLGRLVPVGESTSIDMRYMTPYSMPWDLVGGKIADASDTAQYSGGFDVAFPGLPGFLWDMATGKDSLTKRDIHDIEGYWTNVRNFLAPGAYYHVKEKIGPAFTESYRDPFSGELVYQDWKGRELSAPMGVGHSLGVRLERDDPRKIVDQRRRSLSEHLNKLREGMLDDLDGIDDPVEREEIMAKYSVWADQATEAFLRATGPRR